MVTVTASRSVQTVVVSRDRTAEIERVRPQILEAEAYRQVQTVERTHRNVEATSTGLRGPRGERGLDASGIRPPFTVSHGDATPSPAQNLGDSPVEVLRVSLEVEVPFDALNPRLALGTADAPELLVPYLPGLLSSGGIFEFTPRAEMPANSEVIATLLHDAAGTQGRVQVVITALPLT